MIKRIFASVIAVVTVFALAIPIAGCQSSTSSVDKENALSIWVREDDKRPYVEKVFKLYESKTGNAVDVTYVPVDDFQTKVIDSLKDGTGPDILMHYNNSELTKIGLDNFLMLNDQEWADSLTSGSRAYCDDGSGNLVGLPFWESSLSGCYYNKKIMDQLGLKPASTQREFEMLCQAIKNTGRTPLFWGEKCGWMYQFGLDPIFYNNPDLLQQLNNDEITYADIPEVHDMVQWIFDAYQKGWLGDVTTGTYNTVGQPVASGEVVMVDIWDTWFEEGFTPGEYTIDDFAIMPVFMGTSNDGTYEGGNLNMMLINKNAKHLDEAIGFLEFCADPEVYNEAFEGVPSTKVFKDQTTILTADMLVEASDSIEKLELPSTANPRINGYAQADMITAFTALFSGEVDVDGCIAKMDELRLANQS